MELARSKLTRAEAEAALAAKINKAVDQWWEQRFPLEAQFSKRSRTSRIFAAKCLIECGLEELVMQVGDRAAISYLEAWAEEVPYMNGGSEGQ